MRRCGCGRADIDRPDLYGERCWQCHIEVDAARYERSKLAIKRMRARVTADKNSSETPADGAQNSDKSGTADLVSYVGPIMRTDGSEALHDGALITPSPEVMSGCNHPDRRKVGHGLCNSCYQRERRRNGTESVEYRAWLSARARCTNPNHQSWHNYGGRGITMAPEWIASFEAFLAYIGPKPSPELTLERIDNERGYEPGNVTWATRTQQARNRRPRSYSGGHAHS